MTTITSDDRTEILTAIAEIKGMISGLVDKDTAKAKTLEDFETRLRNLETNKSSNSGALAVVAIILSIFGASIASHYIGPKESVTIQQPTTNNEVNK